MRDIVICEIKSMQVHFDVLNIKKHQQQSQRDFLWI